MTEEIELLTQEKIELIEQLRPIFLPSANRQVLKMRQQGRRFAHYTTAESGLKIIRSKVLWLRSTTAMADYSEVQHGFREVTNCAELKSMFVAMDEHLDGAGKLVAQEFDRVWSNVQLQTYLASVSEHHSDEDRHGRLSMWRGFGRNAARVAIVLRVPMRPGGGQPLRLVSSPVQYFRSAELAAELQLIRQNVIQNKIFLAGADRQLVLAVAFIAVLVTVLCLKHEGFREEQEWRLMHLPKLFPSPWIKSAIETIEGVPQKIFKLPLDGQGGKGLEDLVFEELIDRVIVGPSPYPWIMYEAFVEELKAAGIKDAESKVVVSNIPLRT